MTVRRVRRETAMEIAVLVKVKIEMKREVCVTFFFRLNSTLYAHVSEIARSFQILKNETIARSIRRKKAKMLLSIINKVENIRGRVITMILFSIVNNYIFTFLKNWDNKVDKWQVN